MDALVAQDAQAVAASASDHSKATGGLSESQTKWKEARDDDSGKVYYYNSKTGKTSWDREAQRPRVVSTPKEPPAFHGMGGVGVKLTSDGALSRQKALQ